MDWLSSWVAACWDVEGPAPVLELTIKQVVVSVVIALLLEVPPDGEAKSKRSTKLAKGKRPKQGSKMRERSKSTKPPALQVEHADSPRRRTRGTQRLPPRHNLTKEEVRDRNWGYLLTNPFIYTGYREERGSLFACLCSCGQIHNETFNIWSHYIAALYFLNAYTHHAYYSQHTNPSRFVALAAGTLFSVSAVAHTGAALGRHAEEILFRLDRATIAVYFCVFTLVCGYQHFGSREGEEMVVDTHHQIDEIHT